MSVVSDVSGHTAISIREMSFWLLKVLLCFGGVLPKGSSSLQLELRWTGYLAFMTKILILILILIYFRWEDKTENFVKAMSRPIWHSSLSSSSILNSPMRTSFSVVYSIACSFFRPYSRGGWFSVLPNFPMPDFVSALNLFKSPRIFVHIL